MERELIFVQIKKYCEYLALLNEWLSFSVDQSIVKYQSPLIFCFRHNCKLTQTIRTKRRQNDIKIC